MRLRAAATAGACVLALAGCGADGPVKDESSDLDTTPRPSALDQRSQTSPPAVDQPSRSARGIDASHHQGDIDWPRVRADGIAFAYLKATEGSSFTDPAFADNWSRARAAGLRTGGYHYYTLCSPPEAQADHFVATLDSVPTKGSLPPVVDLELIGNCDPPPARGDLRDDVRRFIEHVEAATGRRVVVYFHPDFESHYGLVDEFDRRLWVRRVGDRPPSGTWWMWQRNDRGSVEGIEGPVDLNVLR